MAPAQIPVFLSQKTSTGNGHFSCCGSEVSVGKVLPSPASGQDAEVADALRQVGDVQRRGHVRRRVGDLREATHKGTCAL